MEGGFVPESNKIVNINSIKDNNNLVLVPDKGFFKLKYYKDKMYFFDPKAYVSFIKGVERLVRRSDEYKTYINYLKTEIGLDHCMVLSNVTDEKASIEMHHGPIFTLFDYCAIMVDYMLLKGEPVTTFSVAKNIMLEHYANRIQVVMLSKTAHQLVHSNKIFINPSQAWGDINGFIELYGSGMSKDQILTYNKYVEISEKNKTSDNGLLKNKINNWNKDKIKTLEEDDL